MTETAARRKDRVSRAEKGQRLYETGAVSLRERQLRQLPDGLRSRGVLVIAAATYEVEASGGDSYRVEYNADQGTFRCECPDSLLREAECKHAIAARLDLHTRARYLRAATQVEVAQDDADYGFDI